MLYPNDYQIIAKDNDTSALDGLNGEQFQPYVCTKPDGLTQGLIVGLQNRIDMPGRIAASDLHATVIYSSTQINRTLARVAARSTITFHARALAIEIFGEKNDTLVLTLKSKELDQRNAFWQSLGCKMTWPSYKAHITLFAEPQLTDLTTTALDWQPRMQSYKTLLEKRLKEMPELVFFSEWVEPVRVKGDAK